MASHCSRVFYLYLSVDLKDVGDVSKNGLNFFLGKDGTPDLPLFFQWMFKKLKREKR